MSSLFKVPMTKILKVLDCPNSHSLDICVVYGFCLISRKGQYVEGQEVIYIPIDSIIPEQLERHLFPIGSKIKLDKHRVRQIKIRGVSSQGILLDPKDASILQMCRDFTGKKDFSFKQEEDYSKELGVTHYTPVEPQVNLHSVNRKTSRKISHPQFHKYNGITALKWFVNEFKEDDIVSLTEKCHGSHCRCSLLPTQTNTLWKKIKKFFGYLPEFEFLVGSNNVQITDSANYTGFYGQDIYTKACLKYNLDKILKPYEQVHAEVYGWGIQKNYTYGCKEGEHKLVLFDVKIHNADGTARYLDVDEFFTWCKERNLPHVPELYRGKWNYELAKAMTLGDSIIAPTQKVREGVVVKSMKEEVGACGRKCLKLISEVYLDDKSNSDFN